jgi:hypothetical protein
MSLMIASNEWMTRPDDQRFPTLESLRDATQAYKDESISRDLGTVSLRLQADEEDGSVYLPSRQGRVLVTNYAFGQLAERAKAPAAYLRKLPATLAATNLQWGLEHNPDNQDAVARLLLTRPNGTPGILRAATSTVYERIWNADVVAAIMRMNDRAGGVWQVPLEAYNGLISKRSTTLYASDRDCFIFLTNENALIEMGESVQLRRGFIVWNSEVGDRSLGFARFTYNMVCLNRQIHGVGNFEKLLIRHTASGPGRFAQELMPALTAYANQNTDAERSLITTARETRIANDKKDVVKWLVERGFTKSQGESALLLSESGQDADGSPVGTDGGDPMSVWNIVQGLTFMAQSIKHQDSRVALETKAGGLLDLAPSLN